MKIEQYISQLLYRHQCVVVPGFGAFLTEIQSAHLNANTNSFYPPKKHISFNPHIKNNDGLLANHIALTDKTSFQIANTAIESEVANWKYFLQLNERFLLKNIGEFSVNAERNVVFTPSENTNYLMESFGLNSFVSPIIRREKQMEITAEEKQTFEFIPKERRTRPYLKYAAIFVLALSLGGSIAFKLYENKIAEDTLIVETAVQKQVQNKIQEATFFIENPIPAVTLTVKEEKLSYHIVAGAFRNESNAQKIYEQLLREGYDARRIEANKHGLFPVIYGSYSSLEEAQKVKLDINKTSNPDAWLLIKEL